MKNITFGENTLTKEKTSSKKDEKEIQEVPAEITPKDILKILADNQKKLDNLINETLELYHYYPNNEISTALNSLDMVKSSYNKLFEKVEEFGK